MADTPTATAGPPPTVDPQDPLPDPNWFYRRTFVFVLALIFNAYIWIQTDNLADVARRASQTAIEELGRAVHTQQVANLLLLILYLVAPSAEQMTKMIATASAWKRGVSTSTTQRATGADGAVAATTTVSGMSAAAASQVAEPPAPPEPPVAPVEAETPVAEVDQDADADLPEYAK